MPTRKEILGISSPSSLVLCSFNQFYKLDPEIWSTWMRILGHVPEAVLWMLEFDGQAVGPPLLCMPARVTCGNSGQQLVRGGSDARDQPGQDHHHKAPAFLQVILPRPPSPPSCPRP
eukprot:750429-Hanusia_phi.AAC.1